MWLPKVFRKTITTSLDVVTKDKNKQPHRVMWLPKVSWLEPKEMHSSNQDNMEQCVSNALNVTSAPERLQCFAWYILIQRPHRGMNNKQPHREIWLQMRNKQPYRMMWLPKVKQATISNDVITKSETTMWLSQVNQATISDDVITKGVSTWSRYSSS